MAFRLTSNNGPATYASLAAAAVADAAFAGALTWTVDQAGASAGVTLGGMAYASLVISVDASVRHAAKREATPANFGSAVSITVRMANTTIQNLLFNSGTVKWDFTSFTPNSGIIKNCVFQGTSRFLMSGLDVASATTNLDNCGFYDTASLTVESFAVGVNTQVYLICRHVSTRSTGAVGMAVTADGTIGLSATSILELNNCAYLADAPISPQLAGSGGTEGAIVNTNYCTYKTDSRSLVTVGADVSPTATSTAAGEFVSATDMYTYKVAAKRIGGGNLTALLTDIKGVAYTNPPNVGFSATQTAPVLNSCVLMDNGLL